MIKSYLIHLGPNNWHDKDSIEGEIHADSAYRDCMTTERDAWNKITEQMPKYGINTLIVDLADGLQYESHPEIATNGAWTKQEMKEQIDRLNKMGINVVPKMNFATIHDVWMGKYARMVSTPIYYKVVEDLIDEACELFKPEYFHLGLDEESWRHKHMQGGYGFSCIRRFDLFWHDTFFYYKCVTKNGARPWVWESYAPYFPDDFAKHATNEPIYSPWLYERLLNPELLPDYRIDVLHGMELLDKLNFSVVPTASVCYEAGSTDDYVAYCKKSFKKENLLGYMTAPWCRTTSFDYLTHIDSMDKLNNAVNKYYPEEK